MSAEDWSALGSMLAVAVAIGSVIMAFRANRRAGKANELAEAANGIAGEANRISKEANVAAREALAIEERRDRVGARPEVSVLLGGKRDSVMATAAIMVSHDGTEPLDEVLLRVADPSQVVFFPGDETFTAQGGRVGPQHETLSLAPLNVGVIERREILWRRYADQKATIISDVRMGDDRWSSRHEIDLDDDSRFDR